MKQNIFEIRQRTEDLIAEAVEIWKRSDKSEQLEGLENDPMFRLIMSAIAYQANMQDADLEQLKTEVLQEFEQQLTFDDAGKAMPATSVIKTCLTQKVSSMPVDSNTVFYIGSDNKYIFEPLLSTRVFNVEVKQISQLDGRRWLARLDFGNFPMTNLKGFSFVISNTMFHSVSASIADNGMELPLIAPWDYSNLPMADHFSLDNIIYNRSCGFSGVGGMESFTDYCALNIFGRQNVALFVVDDMDDIEPRTSLDILFEFDGISHGFSFDEDSFHINTILLANVGKSAVTLSKTAPVARLTGYYGNGANMKQFVQLLRPSDDQLFADSEITIRKMAADRFNKGRLSKLLFNLYTKYTSDLYAFQNIGVRGGDNIVSSVRATIGELSRMLSKDNQTVSEGVYAVLKNREKVDTSLEVAYLTTDGSSVNTVLKKDTKFNMPQEFDAEKTVQICEPSEGMDELRSEQALGALKRYALATGGRIVTESDIRLFCLAELMARYGVVRDLIKSICVRRERIDQGTFHSYCIMINIVIASNIYTQRAFAGKNATVESYLQKMIEVRMSGIYPVKVQLELKELDTHK